MVTHCQGLELIDSLGGVGTGAAHAADTAVVKEGGDVRLVVLEETVCADAMPQT